MRWMASHDLPYGATSGRVQLDGWHSMDTFLFRENGIRGDGDE